jgi:hypothetical protein
MQNCPLNPPGHAMWAVPDVERLILHLSTIPEYCNAGRPYGHPDKTRLWQVLKGHALLRAHKPPSWSRCMDVKKSWPEFWKSTYHKELL